MTGTIKRTHFVRFRHAFNARGIIKSHKINEITATPEQVVNRVARIPWGWINKEIYDPDVLPERIERQNMRLFDLLDDGREVGYSIIIDPDDSIKNSFLKASKHMRLAEIENIALFPNEAGHGRGHSFINMLKATLFEEGHELVYLNTSATNHPHLPDFYRRIGMTDLGQDEVPDFNNRQRDKAYRVA